MLRHEADKYLKCFKVKKSKLEKIMDEDLERWTEYLDQVKKEAIEAQIKLEELLVR